MSKELKISELAFVILARSHNPSLLNPDFLRINRIISEDWLVDSTFTTDDVSQTVYQNGFRILMQPERILFEQLIDGDYAPEKVKLKEIVLRFLETLPHVNYTALGINPVGHILFDSQEELDSYIYSHLLRAGDWKHFEGRLPEISLSFTYPFEDYIIQLALKKVLVYETEKDEPSLGILFSGNIHRELDKQLKLEENLEFLKTSVSLWENDIKSYISLVDNCFLKNQE